MNCAAVVGWIGRGISDAPSAVGAYYTDRPNLGQVMATKSDDDESVNQVPNTRRLNREIFLHLVWDLFTADL